MAEIPYKKVVVYEYDVKDDVLYYDTSLTTGKNLTRVGVVWSWKDYKRTNWPLPLSVYLYSTISLDVWKNAYQPPPNNRRRPCLFTGSFDRLPPEDDPRAVPPNPLGDRAGEYEDKKTAELDMSWLILAPGKATKT